MIITIMDYSVGEVIIREVPKDFEGLDGDDILTSMGYSMSNTHYMIADSDLNISIDVKGYSSNGTLN